MEIFSQNSANAYGRAYAVTPETYLQDSHEPANRLTTREIHQIREIREEIESRPKLTRFEARYIRILKAAEQDFCGARPDCSAGIAAIRDLIKDEQRSNCIGKRTIVISLLVAEIARNI